MGVMLTLLSFSSVGTNIDVHKNNFIDTRATTRDCLYICEIIYLKNYRTSMTATRSLGKVSFLLIKISSLPMKRRWVPKAICNAFKKLVLPVLLASKISFNYKGCIFCARNQVF